MLPETMGNVRSPGLRLRNHIITTRRPHTQWEAPALMACCETLVCVCTLLSGGCGSGSSWDILEGLLNWGVTYRKATAAAGRLAHAPHWGFPLSRLIVSSPPLIHVFHLSSNEPSAVWHHSGHLCIGPSTVHC